MDANQTDFAARYWGVLNRLRARAVEAYAARRANQVYAPIPIWGRVLLGLLLAFGAGCIVVPLYYTFVGDGRVELESGHTSWATRCFIVGVTLVATLPGVTIVSILGGAWRSVHARLRAFRAFEGRREAGQAWTRVFEALAAKWNGTVVSGGIETGCRFLTEHHPECAQMTLLKHHGADERRVTLVATLDGVPVLMQLIDWVPFSEEAKPPGLVVVVASRMELPSLVETPNAGPFRSASAPPKIEDTAAHATLVADGLVVGWTPSGASATHEGPADMLLDADRLERIAHTLLTLCRASPSRTDGPRAPLPPSDEGVHSCEGVLDAFLAAIRDRDALGALAHAAPLLFPTLTREPTPANLWMAIDSASAVPTDWKLVEARTLSTTPQSSTWQSRLDLSPDSVKGVDSLDARLSATLATGVAQSVAVHLCHASSGEWSVCGYSVDRRQVLGSEFFEGSD